MKAYKIVKILYKYFPKKYQLDGDYVGYHCGSPQRKVTKVVFAFDISNQLIDFALKNQANMIISHHPLIWGDKKEVLDSNPIIKKLYDRLKAHKIVAFSPHTAVDGARNGLNRWFLDILGCDKIKWLKNDLVQIGYFNKAKTFNFIVAKCKKNFQINSLLTNYDQKNVVSVLMAGGSHGIEAIDIAKKHKVDLLISGEMRHSSWVYAQELDVQLLLVGHYMEAIYPQRMKSILEQKLQVPSLAYKQKNIIKAV